MAASAAFALKPGVWFRRGRLLIVSPDSLGTACPLSGRNSTYRPVQISATSSHRTIDGLLDGDFPLSAGRKALLKLRSVFDDLDKKLDGASRLRDPIPLRQLASN